MGSITATLLGLGPWLWLILAVLLMALETVVPGVHFLWFGMAASVTGVIALALGSFAPATAAAFTWPLQVILFALLSFATVFVVRRWARAEQADSDLPDLNVRAQQYVGRAFVVAEPISGGRGKVKVGDTLWQAEGPDAPAGAQVRVTGTRGTVLTVEAVRA
jgi:hypothetical protein